MSDRPIQLAALTDKNIDFSNLDKGDLCSSESTTAATASVSYLGFSVRDYEIYFQINLFFLLQNCLTLRKNFILCLMQLCCDIKIITFLSTRPTPLKMAENVHGGTFWVSKYFFSILVLIF